MSDEKGLSKVKTLKRARQLERERRRVEGRGAMQVWRRNRRPALVVVATLPTAVAGLLSLLALFFTKSMKVALFMGLGVYAACLVVVVCIMGVLVLTDSAVAEGRKGIARRRIVRERRALLDASEVAGGVELAREERPGGELTTAEPGGGLTAAGDRTVGPDA